MLFTVLLVLVTTSQLVNAQDNKNIVLMSVGIFETPDKGAVTATNPSTGQTGITTFDHNVNSSLFYITYQRQVADGLFVGASLGNTGFKALSFGFGF